MADQMMTAQMPGFRFADPAITQPEAPAHLDTRTHDEKPWIDPAAEAAPRQLKYWTAYRSGPTLSVSGMDAETGTTRTITGVSSLGPGPDSAIYITDGEGQRWELVL